ncbi:MAG: hypothetical protein R3F23_04805 [Verrucomicrobiia bacterium]
MRRKLWKDSVRIRVNRLSPHGVGGQATLHNAHARETFLPLANTLLSPCCVDRFLDDTISKIINSPD